MATHSEGRSVAPVDGFHCLVYFEPLFLPVENCYQYCLEVSTPRFASTHYALLRRVLLHGFFDCSESGADDGKDGGEEMVGLMVTVTVGVIVTVTVVGVAQEGVAVGEEGAELFVLPEEEVAWSAVGLDAELGSELVGDVC